MAESKYDESKYESKYDSKRDSKTERYSHYERIGIWSSGALQVNGEDALKTVITVFYQYCFTDKRIARFFAGIDKDRLKMHQFTFLRMVMSENKYKYDGRDLMIAHSRLFREGLGVCHFDYVVQNLLKTLYGLHMPQDIIDDITAALGPLRGIFVEGENNEKERQMNMERGVVAPKKRMIMD